MTKTTTRIALFGILILQTLTTALFAQTDNMESLTSENVSLRLSNTFHETNKLAKSSNPTAVPGTPLVVPCGLGFSYNTPTCAGSSITLSVGGGTGYYYSWSTHATTQIISDIPKSDGSSVYSVTVTNSTGTCKDIYTTVPIQIIQPTYSITDILASNQLDCTTGNMTFQIQVSNPGNVANLQYSLDGTTWQSSNLFPNKSTGTYQGYVRATSNCTVSYQKFMEEFEPIEFGEIVKSNLGDCVLGNVGVSIQTTGGKVNGYRYRLNGGIWGNVPSYTGLTSGSYYLEAEPINISSGSCSRYLEFSINETNGVSLTSLQKEQETDCILANAAITALSNQPAAASVEYRLNAGTWQSSNRFTGLSSGNYTVDIRSTAGCPVAVSTLSATVTERIYPKLQSIQVLRDRDCTTGDVELNAVLQDASIAARYRLNGGAWTTTPTFTGLSSGTYTIEVSAQDVSTCSSSLSITVQELGQVSITSTAVYNITDCVLGNITIEAKHNALTSTGLQFRINGGTWQSSNWFKGLSAGTHTIEGRVVGDAGCIFAIPSRTVTVTEVSGLTVVDTILLSNHTDCTVGNSRIQINLKQATTAQYRLVGVSNWQSSNIFTNRSTGRYIIEVRPTNAACTERDTVNIDEKTAVIGDLVVTGLTDCFRGNLRVEIPVTGTPLSQPLQYRLAGYSTPSAWQNGNVFANFPGFNYNRVEVKTSSGCVFSKSADFFEKESIAVEITGLTSLSGARDCKKNNTQVRINTSITVEGTGAAVNLWRINGGAWKWSPDFGSFGRDSVWVEVQATDNTRTCIIGKKMLVDEKTPLEIVSLTPSRHDDCILNNAKITTQITGGQGVIFYERNTGGYPSSSPFFSNLSSGLHLITVQDSMSCKDTMSIRIAEPPLLKITSTSKANESDCPAGNAQITVNTSGVRGTLTLKVNNGSPLFSNVIPNLSTGTYAIVAQDAAGCTANTSVSISELAQLSLSLSKLKEEDCIPGNANIVATTTGARGALSFRLDNGTPQALGTFFNVPNGPHTVVAQDAAGCSASANLTIAEASQLQLPDPVVQAVNCFGESNGRISLSPIGGTAPYQYAWSNGRSTAVNQNLRAGSYAVTVTDANGCMVKRNISVTEPSGIGVSLSIVAVPTCFDGSDAVLQSNVEGGSSPYTYAWSNGGTSSTISNLPANAYSLTVTDAHGCKGQASSGISAPTRVTVSFTVSNHLDCIENNVIITANASGGRGNYSYRLDGGPLQASGVFSGKTTGPYTLIAQDGAGCNSLPTSININEALPLSLSYNLQNDQDCIVDNVNIIPIPSNAQGAVNYVIAPQGTWDFSTDLQQKGNGTYTLTALDGRNCSASSTVNINEKLPPLPISLPDVQVCSGTTATLNLIGATTNGMSYSWEVPNGATNPGSVSTFNTTVPGSYRVSMTDVNTGCSQTATGNVVHKPLPLVQLALSDTLSCTRPTITLQPPSTVSTSTYNWKTVSGAVLSTTAQLSVNSAGIYILKVVDAANCTAADTISILSYIPSISRIDTLPSTRCDSANAQIRIQASHPGNWRYRIDSTAAWTNSPVFTGLRAGKHTISVASPDTACIVDTTITIGSKETCIDLCAGDSLLIGTPGLNPWCMKWLPDAGLSNPDSSYTWVKPQSSTIYRLIITNDDGNIIDSLIYNVTLCPQLSISPATLNLCAQDNPTLNAIGGTGPYIWKNEAGQIVGEGAVYSPTEPGRYTVEQVNALSKASPASAQVSKQLGNQKLQIEPALAAICGDSVRLSAPGNFHNFVWRDSNGQALSQKSYAFIKQHGTYTLTAEAGEGCVLDTQTTVFASGFALSIPAEDIVISCNKTRNLPYPRVEIRYGSGIDSLLVTAPEHYQFRAEWRKDCQSCGQVRLSIESEESIGGNTPCTKVIRRTWVARDECGRRASATQIIRWQDNTEPEFVQFPESDTLAWGWPLPTETPIVSDNCDANPKISRTVDSTSNESIKVVQIHWQVQDTCGNSTTRTQIITYLKPVVEDTFNLTSRYNCGDNFTLQTPSNQEPLGVLRPKTVIDAYGFAVQVTKVEQPEVNSTGFYSGEAVVLIPFTNKPARVRFQNLKLNSSYEVLSGNLTAITDPDFKLPKFETAKAKLDICLPPPPPPVGKNGENDGGFDADGKYSNQPPYEGFKPGDAFDPLRDPNGFDAEGIHVETGTIYNPQGCSAKSVDSLGQKCNPTGAGPYYWLNTNGLDGPPTGGGTRLANQMRDTLRPLVIQVLKELKRINDSLELELKADCNDLRNGVDVAYSATGMGDRDLVFGTGDQFFNEGLSKSFESRPNLLPETVQREASHLDLQKKHVKLFECDESLAKLSALSALLLSLQEDPGLSSLVREMIDRLKRVNDADTASLNSVNELIPWLSEQVSAYASNLNNFKFNRTGSIEATPATPRIRHARDWAEQAASIPELNTLDVLQEAKLQAEFESGAEYIGGVHRAFYLRKIARQYQSQWFTTDSSKIGASLFPIEITTGSKGHQQSLLLDQVRITSSGAYVDAYIIANILGKEIVLRALNVPFNPAGLNEEGKMYLVNDVEMRLSNAVMMIFKANTTYASWDCHGFDEAGLDLEFEFCEKLIVPVNPQTQQVNTSGARVKGRATAVIKDLNDFTVAISITPFALTDYPDLQFSVQNAIADFSDTETPEVIKFPNNYQFPEGNYERWRGVYLGQVSVTVPISLTENGQNISVGADNFIIDDQGVSGSAFLANFISLSDGNFGGFAASVDTISVNFLTNHFIGAGLAGYIHLPLFGKPEGAIGPEDCFRYQGRMEPKQGFKFSVFGRENMTMDLLKAKATILSSSSVELQYVGGRFKVRATLNGSITIDDSGQFKTEKEQPSGSVPASSGAGGGSQTKIGLALPPLTFEKLVLSNEAPYLSLGIWKMPASASARLGKFKLGIDAMKLVAQEGNQAGLYIETRVELSDDQKVPAKGAFEIYGELKIENGRQRWVGKGLRIKRFTVDADIKGNTIYGEVFHFDGDSTSVFGSGFRGVLSVKFAKLGDAGIDALAQFGEVSDFKYFMVDVMATLPGKGIPLGPMYIKKLGGGLSNRMSRTDDLSFPTNWANPNGVKASLGNLGTSLSGVQYYPSSDRGLGLRLALMMTAEKEEAFSATVGLEAIFNSKQGGGGINKMALDGFIQFMTIPKPELVPVKSSSQGLDNPANSITNASKVAGFISIQYNFDENIFDANFRVFFNTNNLSGSGDARLYFSPAKWFINIGEPAQDKRVNLSMQVPGLPTNALQMTAYLDIGNGIPAMPPLPAHIRELTGLGATQGAESTRGSGNGFAFGADLQVKTGEIQFLILYASLNAGVGFDLQLQEYNGASCAGGGELGINGWYASGQLWAYVQAEVGLQLKKNGNKFPIASLSAGVALQGQLPNPFWARGSLAGRYKILGGLAKGNFNFKFTIGQPCELVDESGQPIPEPELSLISELRPQNNALGVSQIARPQAVFTLPMDKARVPMLDEAGNTVYYQTSLSKLELRDSLGQVIATEVTYSKDSLQITLVPDELLPANARFTLYTEASCSQNGQVLVTDRDSVLFRTGPASSGIPADNVAFSYPAVGMQSFYRYEKADRKGYIQLKLGQKELLALGQPVFARFEGGGSTTETLVSYSNYDRLLNFDIPADAIQPATAYTLSIVSGGKVLLSFPFRSSQYAYFKDKMAAFAAAASNSWQDWNLNFSAPASEPFDDAEALGRSGEPALVGFEMVIDNYTWYTNNLKKMYYPSIGFSEMSGFEPISRDASVLGKHGELALRFSSPNTLENRLHTVLIQDFTDFKREAELKQSEKQSACSEPGGKGCNISANLDAFIKQVPPKPGAGSIPVMATYRLPGSKNVNSTCSFTLNFGANNQN